MFNRKSYEIVRRNKDQFIRLAYDQFNYLYKRDSGVVRIRNENPKLVKAQRAKTRKKYSFVYSIYNQFRYLSKKI